LSFIQERRAPKSSSGRAKKKGYLAVCGHQTSAAEGKNYPGTRVAGQQFEYALDEIESNEI
jgi:hypothetical protein